MLFYLSLYISRDFFFFFQIVDKEEKEKRKLRVSYELYVWSLGLPRQGEDSCDHVEGEIP